MPIIEVGARASPLSLVQVDEVLNELQQIHPDIEFHLSTLQTTGDQRQDISLRGLEKSDFFTRELDEMLLSHKCRITIHSAKDLPDPLPDGLTIAAITHGIAEWDSLVIRPNNSIESLPSGAIIATSSERREEAVRLLRPDLKFCDLRGTVDQRLKRLDNNSVDGVVVAEAALIRLGLTHMNRIRLPGKTTPFQGKLAVLARADDQEIISLISTIDCRCEAFIPG